MNISDQRLEDIRARAKTTQNAFDAAWARDVLELLEVVEELFAANGELRDKVKYLECTIKNYEKAFDIEESEDEEQDE